ncbi:MAG: hypothetical protein KKB51_16800 [Candidatus Riflebacteria bacterium]|nr:hypothetical protein [Candidatus Riflebacteria bacterium]
MLAIYLSLVVVGIMVAVAGPRGFLLGLGTVLVSTFWILGKTLKVVLDVLDVIDTIVSILSLFG